MAEIIELSRTALHDRVLERLRTMLIEGVIAPGAKLNERELCEKLNVSRTPLREAIKLLAVSGMVDLLPNRGAVAAKLTVVDVVDTFEILAALEGLSGALAAERISDEERAEIRALHYDMLASFERGDLPSYYRNNAEIHAAINRAARNRLLVSTYQSINGRVQALRFRTNQNESRWKLAVQEHQAIIDALDARDADAMRSILSRHLLNKRDSILELLHGGNFYTESAAKS